jgi:hypothetical protein
MRNNVEPKLYIYENHQLTSAISNYHPNISSNVETLYNIDAQNKKYIQSKWQP